MDLPLHVSGRTFKSIGQEYSIYRDKLILDTLVHKIVIPFDELEKVEIHPPNVLILWKEIWKRRSFHFAWKLDLADLYEHVAVFKKTGNIKIYLFTPENPVLFKQYLEREIEVYNRNKSRSA